MADKERIVTRCPACGQRSLFIGAGGHLTCSFDKCPEPDVDSATSELKNLANYLYHHYRRVQAELLARWFHQEYESIAKQLGYTTRPDSAVRWENVPERNRIVMMATALKVLDNLDQAGLIDLDQWEAGRRAADRYEGINR